MEDTTKKVKAIREVDYKFGKYMGFNELKLGVLDVLIQAAEKKKDKVLTLQELQGVKKQLTDYYDSQEVLDKL